MVISYSKALGKEGVLIDAVGFHKYKDLGDPDDPGYYAGYPGYHAIKIERRGGKEVNLLYDSKEDRDAEYDELMTQVRRQTIPAH